MDWEEFTAGTAMIIIRVDVQTERVAYVRIIGGGRG